jgi:crotonobetainyl-CoA:carnitine CoA-transferase CaiB-like acyl-CoA transferase
MSSWAPSGPLAGLKVLDLSRVLAGPWASQIFGDLGADVYKIEQPDVGDDTRRWGPPFLNDGSGDAAYYLCANRNKYSVGVDLSKAEGAALIRQLAQQCDIVLENFRVGALAKYGLDYATLAELNPALIYCSITGFGQYGPYKDRGGYDFLIQGLSGLMSVTGRPDGEPGEGPLKVGLPICDLSTGLYAAISVLAVLHHRAQTGKGQHIDCALLDTQLSLLANQGANFLNGAMAPKRMGNEHPNTVPYQAFTTADGEILVALGNDRHFRAFCTLVHRPDLAGDARFTSNADRIINRRALQTELSSAISAIPSAELIANMIEAGLPGGKVQTIPEALSDPHVHERGLLHEMRREDGTSVHVIGFPAQFSETHATYRRAPPRCAEDTDLVLRDVMQLGEAEIASLRTAGVVK